MVTLMSIIDYLYTAFLGCGLLALIGIIPVAKDAKECNLPFSLDFVRLSLLGENSKILRKILSVLCILSLGFLILHNGVTQNLLGIDNLYLKSDGTYWYYAKINGDLMPIEIEIITDDHEHGGEKHFYLRAAYHDGNYLWSGYCYDNEDLELFPNKEVELNLMYEGNRSVTCKLLNEHAYSEHFHDTPLNWGDYAILSLEIIVLGYEFILVFGYDEDRIKKLSKTVKEIRDKQRPCYYDDYSGW